MFLFFYCLHLTTILVMFLAAAHSCLFYVYFALYLMFVSASEQVFNRM